MENVTEIIKDALQSRCGGYDLALRRPDSNVIELRRTGNDDVLVTIPVKKLSDGKCTLTIQDPKASITLDVEHTHFPFTLDKEKKPQGDIDRVAILCRELASENEAKIKAQRDRAGSSLFP